DRSHHRQHGPAGRPRAAVPLLALPASCLGRVRRRPAPPRRVPAAERRLTFARIHPANRDTRMFANTPEPPYYAAIFTSRRTDTDGGYAAMAQRMGELAAQQPGYLGIESVRAADGSGITVSYWDSLDAIAA